MDKGKRISSIEEAEALFSKAANAEIKSNYDLAFSLYVQAGQAYLDMMKRANGEQMKMVCKKGVEKCTERAQRIRDVKKDLKSVVRNPFEEVEQSRVLENSSRINGTWFPVWNGWAEKDSMQASSSSTVQPNLGTSISAKSPVWRRPQDVFDEIEIASPFLRPEHIFQNSVTDCSVCSSISVCLRHQQMFGSKLGLSCLFPQTPEGIPRLSQNRRYSLRVSMNGTCREVSIDDCLPFYPDGRPISVSTAPHRDLWPSLVEKGYMKLMGGYDFPGSNSSVDINTLTGWMPEHVEIQSPAFESEKAWARILHNFLAGRCVLTIGTGARPARQLHFGDIQLLPTHSYAVIDVSEEGDERCFTILNPWDGSVDGDDLPAAFDKMHLQNSSTAIRISWEDVCVIFDGIYLNWDPSQFADRIEFHSSWKPRSEKTTAQPVHCHLRFNTKGGNPGDEIWVLLTRHFVDRNRQREYIAIHVQQDEALRDALTSQQATLRGTYTSSTHVLARHVLEETSGIISAVASYDGEYEEVGFTVQVFAASTVEWVTEPRKPMYAKTITGRFTSMNCGGNCTHSTFMNNPQYRLRIHPDSSSGGRSFSTSSGSLARAGKVNVRLSVEGPRSIPLNITLVWSKGERVFELKESNSVASSGAYNYGIAQMSAMLAPDDYTIVLSAFEPRHRGAFTLQVECSSKVEIDSIPIEGEGMFNKVVKGSWDHGTDGGSPRFGRYAANPMFLVEVKASTSMKIRLQSNPSTSLNVTLFDIIQQQTPSDPNPSNLGKQIATSGLYRESIAGVVTPQFTIRPGRYVLVASTFDPGIHASFVMTVYSRNKDDVVKAV